MLPCKASGPDCYQSTMGRAGAHVARCKQRPMQLEVPSQRTSTHSKLSVYGTRVLGFP